MNQPQRPKEPKEPTEEQKGPIEGLADPAEVSPNEDQATGSEGCGRTVGLGGYGESSRDRTDAE